jgi:hypothetical protein
MDIITIEGEALRDLLREVDGDAGDRQLYRLRVARDGDGVKFKLDEGVWSPPYPEADEDVRRRRRLREMLGGA